MSHTVHITAIALTEIDGYLMWTSKRAPLGAARWYERIMKAIDSLEENPQRCPPAPEDEWYDGELRQLVFGKRRSAYRILFEIRGNFVFVLRVVRGAHNLLKPDELG